MPTTLIEALSAYTEAQSGASPFKTAIPGITIMRSDRPKLPMPLMHKAAICLVAQGAKRGIFGETTCEYRAGQALVVGIETPAVGWVSHASAAEPYLGMVIEFDVPMMREVLAEIGDSVDALDDCGVFVTSVSEAITQSAVRLVSLLGRPQAIPVIAPLAMRELSYWLLTSPYGRRIAAMIAGEKHAGGIVAAIHTLRKRFSKPVRITELATVARMSMSTFHRRFKTVTSMTPLQYQKQLRLLEARHVMIADGANAETAAFHVGYESQSQFSREYARMFGAPPRRDVTALETRGTRGIAAGDKSEITRLARAQS